MSEWKAQEFNGENSDATKLDFSQLNNWLRFCLSWKTTAYPEWLKRSKHQKHRAYMTQRLGNIPGRRMEQKSRCWTSRASWETGLTDARKGNNRCFITPKRYAVSDFPPSLIHPNTKKLEQTQAFGALLSFCTDCSQSSPFKKTFNNNFLAIK